MSKVIITQSNYIPWKGYFSAMRQATHLVLYDDMQYTKRDWRNRNMLITPNGPKWLSIPIDVKGKFFYASGAIANGVKNDAFTFFLLFFYSNVIEIKLIFSWFVSFLIFEVL